jgi:hypothetical protein
MAKTPYASLDEFASLNKLKIGAEDKGAIG